jgi:hypothetical protein
MAILTVDEFKAVLRAESPEKVARELVLGGEVFLAQQFPTVMTSLRNSVCPKFGVLEENVALIGSAKMGFSLDPDEFPRAFRKTGGDVDVLIVSDQIFDKFWEVLLRWHYPRRVSGLNVPDSHWISDRRKDLYWGWFHPAEINYTGLSLPSVLRPIYDLKNLWFNTFQALSLTPAFSGRKVNGRLYRTWEHALWYQSYGLNILKRKL